MDRNSMAVSVKLPEGVRCAIALRGCFESHRASAGLAASLLSISRIMAA